jgi:hypothetical protein
MLFCIRDGNYKLLIDDFGQNDRLNSFPDRVILCATVQLGHHLFGRLSRSQTRLVVLMKS